MRKVVISGMLGNGLEWYDFALYGNMAFILSRLFFPQGDEAAQLLSTFAVFAVGFVFRPLGAVLFGYIGDKFGRKISLVIAILMMAIPTGCIGLLPTYAEIGLWAPALLVLIRIFQGLSLGGEFSGSITYIIEHAPPHRRGWAGAASLGSLIIGFLLGSMVSLATVHLLAPEDFESWGWRVPFLLGIAIGLIGFYIRHSCTESPAYEEARAEGHLSDRPLREAFKKHPRSMLQAFAIYMTVTMPFYLSSIYMISFTEKHLGRTAQEALSINTAAMLMMLAGILFGARISDRVGRRRVMIPAALAILLFAFPMFELLGTRELGPILAAQVIFGLILGIYLGPMPAALMELFPTSVRYTGMAVSYNLAAALVGGTTPMVCEWLIRSTGSYTVVPVYMAICCVCSLWALKATAERFRENLNALQ